MEINVTVIFSGLAILVAITALLTAHKIMVYQLYAGLVADYRSPEMGAAILALFHFFVKSATRMSLLLTRSTMINMRNK